MHVGVKPSSSWISDAGEVVICAESARHVSILRSRPTLMMWSPKVSSKITFPVWAVQVATCHWSRLLKHNANRVFNSFNRS